MEEENKNLPNENTGFKFISKIIIAILFLASIGGVYYYYDKYTKTKNLLDNPDAASRAETEAVIAKLQKLMVLPEGENPSVATVLDVEKIKDQPFFTKASNGDKVVIYTKAKIAILYSPEKNLIVNVSPVSTEGQTEAQTVKTVLYNGTGISGLTQTVETNLKSKFSGLNVVSKANASKNNYEKSIVVDLTGDNSAIAKTIAGEIGADVSSLPEGEVSPKEAQILIIIGANYK